MPQTRRSRSHPRPQILRPLTLTVFLALAACGTTPQFAGSRAAGAGNSQLSPEQNATTLVRIADDTRAGGDYGSAVGLYQRAHDLSPTDPVPLTRLAEALAQIGAYPEAAQVYQQALGLKPGDADIQRGLGNVSLALGKPAMAISYFEMAAEKAPNDPRLLNSLGVARDMTGRHDLAQQDYRKGLAAAPDNLNLRNNLGLSQALAGDYNGAIATLGELVARPGATARNRQNLALVYGLAGDSTHSAAVARTDLDEAAVRSNLAYYGLLRSLDDVGRTAAILGADVRAARAAVVKEPAIGEVPTAAPLTPVASNPIQPPPATAAIAPAPEAAQPALAAQLSTVAASAPLPPAPVPVPPKSAVNDTPQPAPLTVAAPEPQGDTEATVDAPVAVQAASIEPASAPTPALAPEAPQVKSKSSKAIAAKNAPPVQVASAAPMSLVNLKSEAPVAPAVAAEPVAASEPVVVASAPAAAQTPANDAQSDGTPHATSAAGNRIVVQAGCFQVEANAIQIRDRLTAKGFTVTLVHDRDRSGRDWYVLRSEAFPDHESAAAMARKIRDAGESDVIVVKLAPSSHGV